MHIPTGWPNILVRKWSDMRKHSHPHHIWVPYPGFKGVLPRARQVRSSHRHGNRQTDDRPQATQSLRITSLSHNVFSTPPSGPWVQRLPPLRSLNRLLANLSHIVRLLANLFYIVRLLANLSYIARLRSKYLILLGVHDVDRMSPSRNLKTDRILLKKPQDESNAKGGDIQKHPLYTCGKWYRDEPTTKT